VQLTTFRRNLEEKIKPKLRELILTYKNKEKRRNTTRDFHLHIALDEVLRKNVMKTKLYLIGKDLTKLQKLYLKTL